MDDYGQIQFFYGWSMYLYNHLLLFVVILRQKQKNTYKWEAQFQSTSPPNAIELWTSDAIHLTLPFVE